MKTTGTDGDRPPPLDRERGSRRHALIISLAPVDAEPRVRRQSRALHEAGWDVSVAGFRGQGAVPEFWRYIEVAHGGVGMGLRDLLRNRAGRLLGRFSERAGERAYWSAVNYEGIYQHLAHIDPADYDLILAHDWFAAPVAERLAKKLDIPFSIDLHEYSRAQYMSNRLWRLVDRPWVHAMQARFLPRAAALTTVCDGIADLLFEEYPLAERPTVIRSFAEFRELPVRPTGERITALYHGILAPTRGLEEAIASAPEWKPDIHLVVRGNGPESYVSELNALIDRMNVRDRVTIEGPVPAVQMVDRANAAADIGYFVQAEISPQKRFTLPNKFFEYVTARLALCVSDLPEMARFVNEHDLGVLVGEATPASIAAALNGLDRDAIDRFKRHSAEAARILDWNREKEVMLRLYDRLVPPGPVESEARSLPAAP